MLHTCPRSGAEAKRAQHGSESVVNSHWLLSATTCSIASAVIHITARYFVFGECKDPGDLQVTGVSQRANAPIGGQGISNFAQFAAYEKRKTCLSQKQNGSCRKVFTLRGNIPVRS